MPVTIRPDITKFGPGPAQLALEAVTGIAMEVVSTKREKAALEELAVTVETENPFLASVIRAQSKNLSSSSNIGGGGRGPGGGSSAGTFQEILRSAIDAEADQRKFGFDKSLEATSNANMMGRISQTAALQRENEIQRHELDKNLATHKQILEELPQTPEGKETRDIIQASALFGLSADAVKINQDQQVIEQRQQALDAEINGASSTGKMQVPYLEGFNTPQEIQDSYFKASDATKKTMQFAFAKSKGLVPEDVNFAEDFILHVEGIKEKIVAASQPPTKGVQQVEVTQKEKDLYFKYQNMVKLMETFGKVGAQFNANPVEDAAQQGVKDLDAEGFRKRAASKRKGL